MADDTKVEAAAQAVYGMGGMVHLDQSVDEAERRMHESDLQSLFVINGDELVGTIGIDAILERREEDSEKSGTLLVREIMNHDVVTCRQDATVREAVEKLDRNGAVRIAVVNDENELVGVALARDLAALDPDGAMEGHLKSVSGSGVEEAHRFTDVSGGRARSQSQGAPPSYSQRPKVAPDRQV